MREAEEEEVPLLQMLGYELPPYVDDDEAWQPPQEYRLPRYVARRNRVAGGLVVTLKLHAEAPLAHCTSRFAHAATECYHSDRCATISRAVCGGSDARTLPI